MKCRAIRQLKNGKSRGVDNIPPEVIKAMDNISVNALHHIINRIWNEEQIPDDWRKELLVKLPKKGDLFLCNNWRGITLLSIPSKILCSVILQRIKTEQAGFRQEHSCVDQIATLRIIVEQIIEWQTSLCMNFIDFEKSLLQHTPSGTVKNTETLWHTSEDHFYHTSTL